jgi:hypothetical protein
VRLNDCIEYLCEVQQEGRHAASHVDVQLVCGVRKDIAPLRQQRRLQQVLLQRVRVLPQSHA